MFGQQNVQQIARVAEQTVLNLKNLESTLEVLRNDLAWLCQSIGHTEAARIALTPVGYTGIPQLGQIGQGQFGQAIQAPFSQPAFGPAYQGLVQQPFGALGAFGGLTQTRGVVPQIR